MAELPRGTVTFLFTDVEGSTQHQRRLGARWAEAHTTQRQVLRTVVSEAGGDEVDAQGDSFFAVFTGARAAVEAAVTAQRSLQTAAWPDDTQVLLRMGIHTGEPILAEEGYLGLAVVRAARICAVARGGQVLVSEATRALVRDDIPDGISLEDAGRHVLKDFDEPEPLFQLVAADLPSVAPVARGPEPRGELVGGTRGSELGVRALAAAGQLEDLGAAIEREVSSILTRAGIDKAVPVRPTRE